MRKKKKSRENERESLTKTESPLKTSRDATLTVLLLMIGEAIFFDSIKWCSTTGCWSSTSTSRRRTSGSKSAIGEQHGRLAGAAVSAEFVSIFNLNHKESETFLKQKNIKKNQQNRLRISGRRVDFECVEEE